MWMLARIRPDLSRVLDILATRLGLFLVLSLLVLTSTAGVLYVERSVAQFAEDHSVFKDQQVRNGFQAMSDMQRLLVVTKDAHIAGAFDDAAKAEFTKATDILYVRAENFRRVTRSNAPVASALLTLASLDRLIARADAAVTTDFEGVDRLWPELRAAADDTRRALVLFLDDTDRMQRAVLEEQGTAVARQRAVVVASLSGLTLIGGIALMLLRREVLARRARERAERDVEFLAYFDPMTGLPNRAQFQRRLETLLNEANPVVLALVDLDEFKSINDTYGHAAGDAVLKHVASLLSGFAARHDGVAARLGGDEFAIIFPSQALDALKTGCAQLLDHVKCDFMHKGEKIPVGVSIGLACSTQLGRNFAHNVDNLVRVTDFALYASKESGRGRVTVYDQSLEQRFFERTRMIADLPNAIENNELVIFLQPKVRLPDRTVYGFEALVRWFRDGKIVPPDAFISVAEDSGLVVAIDRYMLDTGTQMFARYNRDHNAQYSVSINLSAVHFTGHRIVSWVEKALETSGLHPRLLTLEITETVEMRDWQKAQEVIAELSALGVRISIDDFGTGYSSLGYLRSTAADELKIDKSLVHQIETSQKARFLLDGVLDMAQNLSLEVVIEGVETQEQERTLIQMGANRAQGYLYGRAVPAMDALGPLQIGRAKSV